jgi:hypothetical protein
LASFLKDGEGGALRGHSSVVCTNVYYVGCPVCLLLGKAIQNGNIFFCFEAKIVVIRFFDLDVSSVPDTASYIRG